MVETARRTALPKSTAGWLRSLRARMVDAMAAFESAGPELDASLQLAVISGLEVNSLADGPLITDVEHTRLAFGEH